MSSFTIVDTGPIVSLLNKNDQFHSWVISQIELLKFPLKTCEPVVTEACYLLNQISPNTGSEKVLTLLEKGVLDIDFKVNEHVSELKKLSKKYFDVPIDFADACLIKMSEVFSNSKLITLDSDFLTYRKYKKKLIPLITPW